MSMKTADSSTQLSRLPILRRKVRMNCESYSIRLIPFQPKALTRQNSGSSDRASLRSNMPPSSKKVRFIRVNVNESC
jgi:hypothetical protein